MSCVNHHYNPQVYLKRFTNPAVKKQIWEADLTTGKVTETSPKKTGCADYYHSFVDEQGVRDDTTIEKSFAGIENKLNGVFDAIKSRKKLTVDQMVTLSRFAALQRARNPKMMHQAREFTSEVLARGYDIWKHSPKFDDAMRKGGQDPDEVRKVDFKIEANRDFVLQSVLTVWDGGNLARVFGQMQWRFLVAPAQQYFWTSDDPVCCFAERQTNNPLLAAVGPADSDVEVSFPISRRTCAVATWDLSLDQQYIDINSEQLKVINARTFLNGWRFLYGPINDPLVREFAEARAEQRVAIAAYQAATAKPPE